MKMVGRSRAKMFDLPPRENLKTQLDTMSSGFKGDFFGGKSPNGADFANYGYNVTIVFSVVNSNEKETISTFLSSTRG